LGGAVVIQQLPLGALELFRCGVETAVGVETVGIKVWAIIFLQVTRREVEPAIAAATRSPAGTTTASAWTAGVAGIRSANEHDDGDQKRGMQQDLTHGGISLEIERSSDWSARRARLTGKVSVRRRQLLQA
jgi:hypothetical protein